MATPPRPKIPKLGLGHQFIADLYDCAQPIEDPAFIRHLTLEAASIANATVLKEVTHEFSPHGISCVLVIAESHLAVHTWPEYKYVAVDLFTCDLSVGGEEILHYFESQLGSARSIFQRIGRGISPQIHPQPVNSDVRKTQTKAPTTRSDSNSSQDYQSP